MSKEDFSYFYDSNCNSYVVYRKDGAREMHAHMPNKKGCIILIKLACKNVLPRRGYLRNALQRITYKEEYKAIILNHLILTILCWLEDQLVCLLSKNK